MRRCIALFELAYFFGEKPNELLYDFGERVGAGRLEVPSDEDAGVASQPRLRGVVAPAIAPTPPTHSEARNFGQ